MWLVLAPQPVLGGKVVLRIRAGNPIDKPQTVRIRSNLPPRVGTNDIINLSGLDLGYDVKNGVYYVHKEVELGPREMAVYDVEIRDIWVVEEAELNQIAARARDLTARLESTAYHERAGTLLSDIGNVLARIRADQESGALKPGVTPVQHIRTHEANLELLTRVRKDLGRIENLVLASGQDPGPLTGEARDSAPRREPAIAPEDFKTAVIRITVRNTSPSEARKVDVSRDLPPEIKAGDVLDAGGLEVGTDDKRKVVFVFKKQVEIGPNETLTYDVRIRDKWNVNKPRIRDLDARIATVIEQVGQKEQYTSVVNMLSDLRAELKRIDAQEGPEQLNNAYVAFYRDQAAAVDLVEEKVYRVESALRPVDKKTRAGFPIQPPSMKTTWLIIYCILGFLAVISTIFFLRWLGRTKQERMQGK